MKKTLISAMAVLLLLTAGVTASATPLGDEIKNSKPEPGQVFMWWVGQSGWIIKSSEVTILIDPYLGPKVAEFPRLFPTPVKPEELTDVDYIFSSHQHLDHFDIYSIPKLMKASPNCKLIVEAGATKLKTVSIYPADRVIGVTRSEPGKETVYDFPGISFRAVKAWHDDLFDSELRYYYVGYVITIGSVTIYHTGDTQYRSSQANDAGAVDVLLVPINGKWGNMNCQSAVKLAGETGPKLAIPMHWGMVAHNSWDPNDFVKTLAEKYPSVPSLIPEVGKRITLPLWR